jgi:hypothetical protein
MNRHGVASVVNNRRGDEAASGVRSIFVTCASIAAPVRFELSVIRHPAFW